MTADVRRANITQISRMMEYSVTAFAGTTYDTERTPYNAPIWRKTLINALRDQAMLVLAAWDGERCVGLLVGQIAPMAWSAATCATDMVFVADKHGDELLARFVAWCDANKVARIDMGVSDHGQRPGFDRLFSIAGFTKAGGLYYRVTEKAK